MDVDHCEKRCLACRSRAWLGRARHLGDTGDTGELSGRQSGLLHPFPLVLFRVVVFLVAGQGLPQVQQYDQPLVQLDHPQEVL